MATSKQANARCVQLCRGRLSGNIAASIERQHGWRYQSRPCELQHLGINTVLRQVPAIWRVRTGLRRGFFASLRHIASIDETRQLFSSLLYVQNATRLPSELSASCDIRVPYPEFQRESARQRTCLRSDIIFVTGRFRSGSTLLWNLLRNVSGVTSYYEPFNERRWFDPTIRGTHVDPTHRNVENYWAEYDGLEELGRYFEESWKFHHLYMTAEAWNPNMQRFIEVMVEKARGRPALQFNEVDFRLPWLKARFPRAKLVHIFRHPRDQWCSTLGGEASRTRPATLREFERFDGFYLLRWAADLKHYFPFLTLDQEAHPYELFYQLWKLSFIFGRVHADISISLEEIGAAPEQSLERLFSALEMDFDRRRLLALISPVTPGRWKRYANAEWFEQIEARVDTQLEDEARTVLSRPARP